MRQLGQRRQQMLRTYYITALGLDKDEKMQEAYVLDSEGKIKQFSSQDAAVRWLNINAGDQDVMFEIHRAYKKS